MPLLTTPEVAEVVGVTYRQLDSWVRAGYLPMAGKGSGFTRRWGYYEIVQVARLAALVDAGIEPHRAARFLEEPQETGSPPGPVTITLDYPAIDEWIAGELDRKRPQPDQTSEHTPIEGNPR